MRIKENIQNAAKKIGTGVDKTLPFLFTAFTLYYAIYKIYAAIVIDKDAVIHNDLDPDDPIVISNTRARELDATGAFFFTALTVLLGSLGARKLVQDKVVQIYENIHPDLKNDLIMPMTITSNTNRTALQKIGRGILWALPFLATTISAAGAIGKSIDAASDREINVNYDDPTNPTVNVVRTGSFEWDAAQAGILFLLTAYLVYQGVRQIKQDKKIDRYQQRHPETEPERIYSEARNSVFFCKSNSFMEARQSFLLTSPFSPEEETSYRRSPVYIISDSEE